MFNTKDAVLEIHMRSSKSNSEYVFVKYSMQKSRLSIGKVEQDRTLKTYSYPLVLQDHILQLQIFLDRTSLEVFANDQIAGTLRMYIHPDNTAIRLLARGTIEIDRIRAWALKSTW